ncbi:hypothetical protein CCACVL1_01597 [Corchorus capsularis]|uniref:CASP-like protein n=1 Tax=Corchorus capsularis TaxID=210143 RepID=A0A1R3KH24_COCAP|nr:hypothetical protein CCACVL1_01597 [Corchorus capsularis]
MATALAATWVMVTNKQTVLVFSMSFEARYSFSSALKFFAFANAFACGFTFLSLLYLILFGRHGLTPVNYFVLFLHDLFMMSLVLSGVAAATAIGYIGQYGNMHAGWLKICDRVTEYCHKSTISVALSYVSLICLLTLTIISASKSRQIKV